MGFHAGASFPGKTDGAGVTFTLLSLLCAAVGLCWVVGAYGRLQRLRAQVVQAFGALDVHAVHSLALLGEWQASWRPAAAVPDLPAAESAALQAATVQMGACLAVARSQPLDAPAMAALSAALDVLQATWQAWLHALGAEEDQAASVPPWQARWSAHQAQQDLAIHVFNRAVQQYNLAIAQCPACLLAWGLAYRPAGLLPEASKLLSYDA